jgi:hypothetical protein
VALAEEAVGPTAVVQTSKVALAINAHAHLNELNH